MVDQGYKSLDTYLGWMLDACNSIIEYTDGISYKEFLNKKIIRDACLMQLQHIGETAFKIDKNHKHNIIDHHKIIGLRHVISHDYLGITHERLWTILSKSIPSLKENLTKEIKTRTPNKKIIKKFRPDSFIDLATL